MRSARSKTGKYSSRRSRFLRNGKPVATIASSTVRSLISRRSSSHHAPPPRRAVYVLAEQRRVDDRDDRDAVLDERDRHADDREAMQEVRGAVERVDEPPERGAIAALLLPHHRDVGRGGEQRGAHRPLARGVGLADPVAGRLRDDVASRAERVAHDRPTGVRGAERGVEQDVEIEGGHAISVIAPRSSSSNDGVAAPISWRPHVGVGGDELPVAGVDDVRAGLACDEQPAEVVPGRRRLVHRCPPVERPARQIAQAQRRRTQDAELLPSQMRRRERLDGDDAVGDPLRGRRDSASDRRTTHLHPAPPSCAPPSHRWRRASTSSPSAIERAQRDRPVRDAARAVRRPVDGIDDDGDVRVGRAAPTRLLADDGDACRQQHVEDRARRRRRRARTGPHARRRGRAAALHPARRQPRAARRTRHRTARGAPPS